MLYSDISCVIEPVGGRGGLYQSSITTAANLALLNQFNIKNVLTCCIEAQLQYGQEITNLVLQCHDQIDFDMKQMILDAHQFLDQSRLKSNVLVHCHAGISRSSCIVLSYLMRKRRLTLEQALIYLTSVRPSTKPNPGFLKQLLLYEQEIFGTIASVLSENITPYYQVQSQLFATPQKAQQEPKQQNSLPSKFNSDIKPSQAFSPQPVQNAQYQKSFPVPISSEIMPAIPKKQI